MSYEQLAVHAASRAAMLADLGIRSGDRVMLEVPVTLDSAVWLHALLWLGAATIPVGPGRPRVDTERLLARLNPRAFICAGSKRNAETAARSRRRDDLIVIDSAQSIEPRGTAFAPARCDPGKVATIILTSGSSSTPKAVPLSLANHAASVRAVTDRIGSYPDDRWLLCLPLEHIGGMAILFRSVMTGASVAFMPRFDAAGLLRQISDQRITLTSLVPGMLDAVMKLERRRPSSNLRAAFVGGAPAAPSLLGRARDNGWPVLPTWGMSEAGSQLATPSPETAAGMDFSAEAPALPPVEGVEVRVARSGAMQVRGPMIFSGYLDDSASGPDENGWFTTSDLGRIGADGRVRIFGRIDNVIISGGINVDLDAVAQRLCECPLIDDAAAVGIASPRWGQRVVAAVVVPKPGNRLADALDAWARDHLQPAERPALWRVVDGIPRSSAGKPMAPSVRALFE